MRIDDLQVLRTIDDREVSGQTHALNTGLSLLEALPQTPIAWGDEDRSFARELLLARDAGYVTWEEWSQPHARRSHPLNETNAWLQEIHNLGLSLSGRDRARGREIRAALPDPPGEDDERPITGLTLEAIARAVADTYTPTQLPRFLLDAGLPSSLVGGGPAEPKWEYMFDILDALHDGGSEARRVLRAFIGSWLCGALHAPPPFDVRRHVEALLAQQGWHILDNRLVIGDREPGTVPPIVPTGTDPRPSTLRPEIRAVIDRYVASGNIEVAIFEAFKAVSQRVKSLSELDEDGQGLMGKVFSDSKPELVVADIST